MRQLIIILLLIPTICNAQHYGNKTFINYNGNDSIQLIVNDSLGIWADTTFNIWKSGFHFHTTASFEVDSIASASTITLNMNESNVFKFVIDQDITLSANEPEKGATYAIIIIQDATGGHSITTWDGNWVAEDGSVTIDPDADDKTCLSVAYDGTDLIVTEITNLLDL